MEFGELRPLTLAFRSPELEREYWIRRLPRMRSRTVLVATCRATARTDLGDEAIGRVDIAGHFAIDTETGLVLQHRYSSFLFMEKDPKKVMPNLRWRGISRQDLE